MKKFWKGIIGFLLAALIIIPFMPQSEVFAAKYPELNKSKITITGKGVSYTLKAKNVPSNVVLKWSSSNKKVATVNGLGTVVAQTKGTTTITCKVQYPDKTIDELLCKVTVKIPATAVSISNAVLTNNAHKMSVGDTYDFNRKIVPSGSSDKTYWEVADTDMATVDSQGVVTALKPGITQLIARSGKNKEVAFDPSNDVTNAINIHIEEPVCEVAEVKLTGDREVSITFTQAMQASTLILGNSLNTNNITIEAKTVDGKKAADLGLITPSLSVDGKVLKLSTVNKWDGVYAIKIENDIFSQAGIAFKGYNEEYDFSDKLVPTLESVTLDDTGFVALIKFNKEIMINNLSVVVDDISLNVATKTALTKDTGVANNNYVLQADNKTIQLDLSKISSLDYNKHIKLIMRGVTDIKGRPTEPYTNTFYVNTDTTQKPNANLIKVERTGKNTFTAHFDRSIQYGGQMIINNYAAAGVVSTTDKKSVVYTFDASIANSTTSYLEGKLTSWLSYNAIASVNSQSFIVDMTTGYIPPVITNSVMVDTMNNNTLVRSIVLTYNKDVTVTNKSGQLYAKYTDAFNNIQQVVMNYTATSDKQVVTILLEPSTTIASGNYEVTIPTYFVYDSYMNYNEQAVIKLTNNTVSSAKLPAPKSIDQDANPSILYVNFGTKVDLATAGSVSSYRIDMKYPISAEVISNSMNGAVVKLTFAPDTIQVTGPNPIYVQNVRGDNGAYQAMDNYYLLKDLKENTRPVLLKAKVQGSTIMLTYSENIRGVASFAVTSYGMNVALSASNPYYIVGNQVFINLAQTVGSAVVTVIPDKNCSILDEAGNPAIMGDSITATNY